MLEKLPGNQGGEQRATLARQFAETAESWLRKLVHAKLLELSGPNYITKGQWKKKLTTYVEEKYLENPKKYPREVDATTFDQLVDMVCHPNYWPRWSDALEHAYPDGVNEARTFLLRIKAVRNDVSHGQVCSARQLEQVICYTNDLVDSIKGYFRKMGMAREFDVPRFVRCFDNQGNSEYLNMMDYRVADFTEERTLFPGELLVAEVEVDPSFESNDYSVAWWIKNTGERGQGTKAIVRIDVRHVAQRMEIQFNLKTFLEWHRLSQYDDVCDMYYKVLPP